MKLQDQVVESECLGLIQALGSETFFHSFWEQQSFSGAFRTHLADCFTPLDIEQLISSLGVPDSNWIQVVRDGKGLAPSTFTNSERFVNLHVVRQAYAEGYTVQLSKMQIRNAKVGQLCREFEGVCIDRKIDLARPIGSHLYITPPHRRGLLPHYDDHNVLVLQLSGVKHWRLYDAPSKPVARQSGDISEESLPPLSAEIELRAGHVLYVPRGCYHEASTGDEPSTHLTLDIYTVTLLELVQEALKRCSGLGGSVPHGLNEQQASVAIQELIAPTLAQLDFAATLTAIRREFADSLYPLPSSGLSSSFAVMNNSVLHHKSGVLPRVGYAADGVTLNFVGGSLSAELSAAALFNFVADNPAFSVSAVPLDEEAAKLEFARTLINAGVAELRA